MSRARIPPESSILVEVGAERPTEVGFDARSRFHIHWVVTDGTHRWKYLWIKRGGSGVYFGLSVPVGGQHFSYHTDGRRHVRVPGATPPVDTRLEQGPPLDCIQGYVNVVSVSTSITSENLNLFSEFNNEAADKIIYLDNRTLGPSVHTAVYLVEPFQHGTVPLFTDRPCFTYLVTHTLPWIMVVMVDQSIE